MTGPAIPQTRTVMEAGFTLQEEIDEQFWRALLAEQAGSLLRAGRRAEAEATCRALLGRDHDPSVTAKARICLGHTLLAGGRARDALRELQRQPPALTCTMPSRASTDHQRPRKEAAMPTTGRTSYGAQERARGGRGVPVRLQVMAA